MIAIAPTAWYAALDTDEWNGVTVRYRRGQRMGGVAGTPMLRPYPGKDVAHVLGQRMGGVAGTPMRLGADAAPTGPDGTPMRLGAGVDDTANPSAAGGSVRAARVVVALEAASGALVLLSVLL